MKKFKNYIKNQYKQLLEDIQHIKRPRKDGLDKVNNRRLIIELFICIAIFLLFRLY